MILFSTLTQPIELFLFCYLGFISGLIFFSVYLSINYANGCFIVKLNSKNNDKKTKQNLKENNKKNSKKFKEKTSNFFAIFLQFFSNFFVIITFCFVLFLSFYLNLIFNYGVINLICIIFYILFFYLSKQFINIFISACKNIFLKTRKHKEKRLENKL